MNAPKPAPETSMKALNLANRVLLAAMAREKRARAAHQVAVTDLVKAKRQVALLVAAISQP
jgi:hypothetical protein